MKNILFFLLIIALYSCKSNYEGQLNIAEQIMNEKPDSAMSILDRININDIANSKDKAKYALLYSMSLSKNYIFSENDSIIQIARNYYKRNRRSRYYCLSEFYYGEILQNRGENTNALIKFLSIIDAAEELEDHYFLGLLYSGICSLYTTQCDFENTLKYARLAYLNYNKADKPRHACFALVDMSDIYFDMQKYDSTLFFLKKAMNISHSTNDSAAIHIIKKDVAKTYIAVEKPQEAINVLWSLKKLLKLDWDYQELTYMCRAHRQLGNYDSAKYYLKEAESVTPDRPKAKAFVKGAAARLHIKTGEAEKAAEEFKYYAHIQDSLVRIALQHSYANQHRDFVDRENSIKNEKLKSLRIIFILSAIVVISVFTIIALIIRSKLLKHKRKELEYMQTIEEINIVNRQGIEKLNDKYESQFVELRQMLKSRFKIIEELAFTYYERSGTQEQRAIYKKVMDLLNDYSNNPATKQEVEEVLNACYNNIIERIKQDMPGLKQKDTDLLIYILAGFSTRAISVLLDETPQNVAVKKYRLKQKMSLIESVDKDYYINLLR